MGKRSNFDRIERDFYRTPREAVTPLLPHLPEKVYFAEPCAGDGALVRHLEAFGHDCVSASDIEPQHQIVGRADALTLRNVGASMFITNPPWRRDILHPLIKHLSTMAPTWLLFDADWPHTKQSADLIKTCSRIVAVGRVKWIPGSKHVGKDNACWYEFILGHTSGPKFIGR